jgi:hypothetical protein
MYVVLRRTWLAGADPSAAPDMTKTVARLPSRSAAEARAESLAPGGRDADARVWRAKARDALHVFEVSALQDAE